MITNLTFIDIPVPYNVTVNSEEWWISGINYTYNGKDMIFTKVPSGRTYVDIYFQKSSPLSPVARFTVSSTIAVVNEDLIFDATNSSDPDGEITAYIWDFGEGNFSSGIKTLHSYSKKGNYSVILTVKDNDFLIDRAYMKIEIIKNADPYPKILHRIPDQEKQEDSPPWSIDLSNYEFDLKDSGGKLNWYLTYIDKSLYTVSGEWNNDDVLTFYPVANAYGNDEVTIWLIDSDGYTDFQKLWINLTPVNDPPIFFGAPDLILHYDDPYTFNYAPYIHDIETPMDDLIISALETSDASHTVANGLNVTFEYPKSMLGKDVYVTIIVSDGEAASNDIIKVTITDDWVPSLAKSLPDVVLYEGAIVTNVFDLDDYFIDPDDDSLFYSYGESHVSVIVNDDHTVDISSLSEWSGTDTVTFRAEDPIGALAEDTIGVTVIPVNDPPTISGIPDLIVHYDYDYEFDLSPYIDDKDNYSSELRIYTSELTHIRFEQNDHMLMIVNYPESMNGLSIPVSIAVSDMLESNEQVINITVTDDYPPEIYTSLPDIQFEEDTELLNIFDLDKFFFDLDGDPLYYTSGHSNIYVTIDEDSSVDFVAKLNWYGTELITFRAMDPIGAFAEDTIIVTVTPVNDAPTISTIPTQKGKVGEMWVLDLSPYIEDVDNNITELKIYVDSSFMTLSGLNLVFYSEKEISKKVTIDVSDGDKNVAHTFSVSFSEGEEVITVSELFIWLIILIILVLIITSAVVYRKYKGNYEVEEVFLIYDNGILIVHRTNKRDLQEDQDDEIISGMLTAIQDFIGDSFANKSSSSVAHSSTSKLKTTTNKEWELQQLKLEGHNILIEHGKNTFLTVVFSGTSGWRLHRLVKHTMQDTEVHYDEVLPNWDGNMKDFEGVENFLDPLLTRKDAKK